MAKYRLLPHSLLCFCHQRPVLDLISAYLSDCELFDSLTVDSTAQLHIIHVVQEWADHLYIQNTLIFM